VGLQLFVSYIFFFKLPLHVCQFKNLEFGYVKLVGWYILVYDDWDMVSRNETQYNTCFLKFKYFVSCTLFAPTNVAQCILKKAQSFYTGRRGYLLG
jgi:hypothetical protein